VIRHLVVVDVNASVIFLRATLIDRALGDQASRVSDAIVVFWLVWNRFQCYCPGRKIRR